jgi:hypothetical protein
VLLVYVLIMCSGINDTTIVGQGWYEHKTKKQLSTKDRNDTTIVGQRTVLEEDSYQPKIGPIKDGI